MLVVVGTVCVSSRQGLLQVNLLLEHLLCAYPTYCGLYPLFVSPTQMVIGLEVMLQKKQNSYNLDLSCLWKNPTIPFLCTGTLRSNSSPCTISSYFAFSFCTGKQRFAAQLSGSCSGGTDAQHCPAACDEREFIGSD